MKWVVVPDLQVPDQDDRAINSLCEFITEIKPDGVLIVGDELDAPEPSRWNRGYAGEYALTLQASIKRCNTILGDFRSALGDGPIHLMRSNHGDRIQTYVTRYAPALASLESLRYDELLGLDDLGITYHRKPYEFAKGWVLAHGDEGGGSQTAAGVALGLAKKWGKSVVCGHTHKAGLQHQHLYLNGKPSQLLYGMEVGHMCNINKMNYLKAGYANWQQAFAVIEDINGVVNPTLHYLHKSRIHYDGKVF